MARCDTCVCPTTRVESLFVTGAGWVRICDACAAQRGWRREPKVVPVLRVPRALAA